MNATQSSLKDDVRMRRIMKVSNILRTIMLAVLILEGVGVAAEVFVSLITIFHPTALKSQIAATNCAVFVHLSLGFMVSLNFFRLFTRLKDGHLFEGQTIEYLEQAGKWWIALGIVQIIYQSIAAYLSFPHHTTGGDGIFSGLVVFFIAWVLREGQKLKEEQELTV
jgi:hypothetical protein